MAGYSRFDATGRRQRRAASRISGRSPGRLAPRFLDALGPASRARGGRLSGPAAAGGLATLFGSLSAMTLFTVLFMAALVGGGGYAAYSYYSTQLPDVRQFEARPFGTTRIFDRNGRLLSEVNDPDLGWRTNVQLDQVSPLLIQATIAAEDPTFASNPGVDPVGIMRAALINYNGTGVAGGSTITQQLVRALFPTSIGNAPTLTRKIKEALLSLRFAKTFPKDQVLQLYLNEIYYGNRSYGIEAAADSYFNKSAKDLDLAEASMLAGLPQAPSFYDPRHNFEVAKVRQLYVLDQMLRNGYIDRAEHDAAFAEPLLPLTREGRYNDAPHFVNYVRDYIEEKYGADKLYRGSLDVYTTLDFATQVAGEKIVKDQIRTLRGRNATNGALVAILPATGEILAMVGSADFYDASIDGQVNVTTRERQPGSSIKPVAYAAAFQKGWSPATRIMDVHTVFPATSKGYGLLEAYRAKGQDLPRAMEQDKTNFYIPENFDFKYRGAVQARDALALSLNIPAIKTIRFATVDAVLDLAHKMGIRTGLWRGAEYYGYTLALGGGEVQPLEHTNVYATFANMGRYVPATPILKIVEGTTGKTLEELDRKGALGKATQALEPGVAYQLTSIMTDNNARAPEYGINNQLILPELNRPAAAKTGTTNDNRDTWTMGYTTDLAVGVWVGNSNNSKMNGVLGSEGPAPIWHKFMVEVHQRPELARNLVDPAGAPYPTDFARPPDVVEADVCTATGKKPVGASTAVRKEFFVSSRLPTQPCDILTPEENVELDLALRDAARNGDKYTSEGLRSLFAYRDASKNYLPFPYGSPVAIPTPRR